MKIITNNGINMRTITEGDAGFILKLRTDVDLSRHLSKVSGTLNDQIAFIKQYKVKEAQKLEYYFIIEYQGNSVGTVRVYNINYDKFSFTWGSWIIERGNPGTVALSSAYMVYYFGFNYLNLNKAEIDVRKDNKNVFKFHSVYSEYIREDELNYYMEFKKEDLYKFTQKFGERIPNNVSILYE